MIAAWMLYATAMAAVLGLAALAAERALTAYRLPARYVWMLALAGAPAVPLVARLGQPGVDRAAEPGAPLTLPAVWTGPSEALDRVGALAAPLDAALLIVWGLTSLVMVATLGVSGWRLARERRRWSSEAVDGRAVLVAPDLGPALIGLGTGAIVIPRWFLDLPAETRRLGLLHEQEHLEARDTRLLAIGTGMVALMPWNPALWWQLGRLRAAIELDCDTRVLGCGVEPCAYAKALLEVGERARPALSYRPALAEPKSLLSRRVGTMFAKRLKHAWLRAAGYGAAAVTFAVLACESPAPQQPAARAATVGARVNGRVEIGRLTVEEEPESGAPGFELPVRFSCPPAQYPRLLLQAGVGGEVRAEFVVGPDGRVTPGSVRIVSAENRAFEAPVRAMIERCVFRPARVGGRAVSLQTGMPVHFSVWVPAAANQGR